MASENCVKCLNPVRTRQEVLICDGCHLRQHRKCDSGISQKQYRDFNRIGTSFEWKCLKCSVLSTEQDMEVKESVAVKMPYQVPDLIMDSSISDDDEVSVFFCDKEPEVVYTQVESGTSRGKAKLFDNQGFSYTIKTEKKTTVWRCSKRSGSLTCPATVIQDGDTYKLGLKNHVHSAEPGIHTATKIKVMAKQKAKEDVFTESCSSIAKRMILSVGNDEEPVHSRPPLAALIRSLQRTRQTRRQNDPTDVSSSLEEDHSARGVYQKSVKVEERCKECNSLKLKQ